jgi:hypothetical protein
MENDEFEDFDSTNVTIDPMNVINRVLIPRMEHLLQRMTEEKRLCDEFGAGVVAEFLFKGNKAEVEFGLKKLIEYRIKVPYEEKDRQGLIEQAERFMKHIKSISEHPLKVKIRQLNVLLWHSFRSDYQFDMEKAQRQLEFNHLELHRKKECICFNNYP